MKCFVSLLSLFTVVFSSITFAEVSEADVIVYGPNSAGIAAAIQVQRMGKTVILVGPDTHLGGLTASGLGFTDSGKKEAVGGFAREYYQRLKAHYDRPDAWVFQKPREYSRYKRTQDAMWVFEPRIAERAFEDLIRESKVPVYRDEWLDRASGVTKKDGRISEIRMLSGNVYRGKMFIDATYEGDLMAAAGVSWTIGREGRKEFGESLAGKRYPLDVLHTHASVYGLGAQL